MGRPPKYPAPTPANTPRLEEKHENTAVVAIINSPRNTKDNRNIKGLEVISIDPPTQEDQDLDFDLKENLQGTQNLVLPNVKVSPQAGVFMFPDETSSASFECVILAHQTIRMFWKKSFDETGGGVQPDCYSNDAFAIAHDVETPQAVNCGVCENAKFGSAGRGQACMMRKKVLIYVPGDNIPKIISFPPTSIKEFERYMMVLVDRSSHFATVVTHFALEKAKNREGIAYARANLSLAGLVETKDLPFVIKTRNSYTALFKRIQITREEIQAEKQKETPQSESPHNYSATDNEDEVTF